jgi:hypothetical protein
MEFKSPSGSAVTETLALTGGGYLGGMVSKGAISFMHNPTATDEAGIKSEENMLLLKRTGLFAAGLGTALFVTGKDTAANVVKGAGIGMAMVQGLELLKTGLEKSGLITADPAASKGKKALATAVGLGCGCSSGGTLNGSRRRSRQRGRLGTPVYAASNMDVYAPAVSEKSLGTLQTGGGLDALASRSLLSA